MTEAYKAPDPATPRTTSTKHNNPSRSPSRRQLTQTSPNRHTKCIAEVYTQRQDKKKWVKNMRSEFLNKRNNIKPIFERANDILVRRKYRENYQFGQKEKAIEEQARQNLHNRGQEQKSNSTTPRKKNINLREIPSFSPNFIKEIETPKIRQIEEEIKLINQNRAKYPLTREPVDPYLAAELREYLPSHLQNPPVLQSPHLPPYPYRYNLQQLPPHLHELNYPWEHPLHVDLSAQSPRHRSPLSPRFRPATDPYQRLAGSPQRPRSPQMLRSTRKRTPRDIKRLIQQNKSQIMEFLSELMARQQ